MTERSERVQRMEADRRAERIWASGGILYDRQREQRIRDKQDWPYLCVRASAFDREIYEVLNERCKPLTAIHGWTGDGPFHVSHDTLMALWRADSRRSA